MATIERIVIKRRRGIKSLNRGRQASIKSKRTRGPARRFSQSMLSPPKYLAVGEDGIWPAVAVPVSVATQYRAKVMQERKRLICSAFAASVCLAVVIGFAKVMTDLLP